MTGFIDPLDSREPGPVDEDAGIAPSQGERDRVRELVLLAHPEVVPELVQGETIAELLASVEPARQAYAALAERFQATVPAVANVPAGGVTAAPVDLDRLPAAEKLRRGLADRQRRSR